MRKLVMGCAVAGLIALSPKTEAKLPDLPVVLPMLRSALPRIQQAIPKIQQAIPNAEVGLASWYGSEFLGRSTASGEAYDPNRFTAAHRKLPFGTLVRVTNLKTLTSALLRVTDRGPGSGGRVIDVSWAAAKELGFLEAGLARVEIEIVSSPEICLRQMVSSRSPEAN
jgi:rare lipoprotein A (peptidoglycan hydrolase)